MTDHMRREPNEPCDAGHEAAGTVLTGAHDPARRRRGMATSPVETMRREVEQRMRRGERFTDVEDVIDASDLPAEEKSALWLLAWSYVHPKAQRREANAHLDHLTAATSPPATNRKRHLRIAG
jgi:hypothetical protein